MPVSQLSYAPLVIVDTTGLSEGDGLNIAGRVSAAATPRRFWENLLSQLPETCIMVRFVP
ncbi:MAG: hypothetical protein ACYDG2_03850 [Ruminiclostridium sp.]